MGRLVPDAAVSRAELLRGLPGEPAVIAVGDATSDRVRSLGMRPVLEIVDGFERRVRRREGARPGAGPGGIRLAECENRPGGICLECAGLVRTCLRPPLRPSRILVDGEEDLLAVPACLYAPDGSAVMYGQPGEGIVVVPAGLRARNRAKSILDRMGAGHDETVAV